MDVDLTVHVTECHDRCISLAFSGNLINRSIQEQYFSGSISCEIPSEKDYKPDYIRDYITLDSDMNGCLMLNGQSGIMYESWFGIVSQRMALRRADGAVENYDYGNYAIDGSMDNSGFNGQNASSVPDDEMDTARAYHAPSSVVPPANAQEALNAIEDIFYSFPLELADIKNAIDQYYDVKTLSQFTEHAYSFDEGLTYYYYDGDWYYEYGAIYDDAYGNELFRVKYSSVVDQSEVDFRKGQPTYFGLEDYSLPWIELSSSYGNEYYYYHGKNFERDMFYNKNYYDSNTIKSYYVLRPSAFFKVDTIPTSYISVDRYAHSPEDAVTIIEDVLASSPWSFERIKKEFADRYDMPSLSPAHYYEIDLGDVLLEYHYWVDADPVCYYYYYTITYYDADGEKLFDQVFEQANFDTNEPTNQSMGGYQFGVDVTSQYGKQYYYYGSNGYRILYIDKEYYDARTVMEYMVYYGRLWLE